MQIREGIKDAMENEKLQDEGLKGNEYIEDAILALQQNATPELLAHTLTVIRRRMKEGGQFIVDVEPSVSGTGVNLKVVETADGAKWWTVFTSFEEELKGADSVKSTFLTDMERLFEAALSVSELQGIIVNPWNRTIALDKHLLRIIKPENQ